MTSELVFGFDIGTTSIGSAVVRMDSTAGTGDIIHLGVRIFPEARDPDGIPLNQERRKRRMMRRQLRRRRTRRRDLNQFLREAGLLPDFSKAAGSEWAQATHSRMLGSLNKLRPARISGDRKINDQATFRSLKFLGQHS